MSGSRKDISQWLNAAKRSSDCLLGLFSAISRAEKEYACALDNAIKGFFKMQRPSYFQSDTWKVIQALVDACRDSAARHQTTSKGITTGPSGSIKRWVAEKNTSSVTKLLQEISSTSHSIGTGYDSDESEQMHLKTLSNEFGQLEESRENIIRSRCEQVSKLMHISDKMEEKLKGRDKQKQKKGTKQTIPDLKTSVPLKRPGACFTKSRIPIKESKGKKSTSALVTTHLKTTPVTRATSLSQPLNKEERVSSYITTCIRPRTWSALVWPGKTPRKVMQKKKRVEKPQDQASDSELHLLVSSSSSAEYCLCTSDSSFSGIDCTLRTPPPDAFNHNMNNEATHAEDVTATPITATDVSVSSTTEAKTSATTVPLDTNTGATMPVVTTDLATTAQATHDEEVTATPITATDVSVSTTTKAKTSAVPVPLDTNTEATMPVVTTDLATTDQATDKEVTATPITATDVSTNTEAKTSATPVPLDTNTEATMPVVTTDLATTDWSVACDAAGGTIIDKENVYVYAVESHTPTSRNQLRFKKGQKIKIKIKANIDGMAYGWKRSLVPFRKTFGFFPIAKVALK